MVLNCSLVRCFTAIPLLLGWLAVAAEPRTTFTNPILTHGADPWVLHRGNAYHYCFSRDRQVWVGTSRRLEQIGAVAPVPVWTPGPGHPWSRNLWAPELHFLRGRYYIYVAADDGDNARHRMFVLEGDSSDPQRPFQLRGKIHAPDDHWAIDGTVLTLPGDRLYFLWSGWEGETNGQQNLYIAPMSDPLTISGPRVRISEPTRDWERHGRPWVNEGPQVLWHGDRFWVIYSASGSWTDDYCLGALEWSGGDVLRPESWVKRPAPVFARTETVFGPGHASFVTSPDGTEDWIVYHAAQFRGAGWKRDIRMQRFAWNADGSPDFGTPVATGVPLALPSGTPAE